ncbi:MAG: septum formation initiator family protein [Patescibacteria group bacterium]
MRGFQEKKRWRNILESKPVLTLLAVLFLLLAWSVYGLFGKMEGTRKNRGISENKVKELELKKENLSADIGNLNTEEGVERNIREKYGLAKPGEGVIIIVDDQKPESDGKNRGGFWNWLKNLFK